MMGRCGGVNHQIINLFYIFIFYLQLTKTEKDPYTIK